MSYTLNAFFNYPHVEGYVRWPISDTEVYYFTLEDSRKLILEMLHDPKKFWGVEPESVESNKN